MTPLDVKDTIDCFNVGPMSVTRRTDAQTVNGFGEVVQAVPAVVVLDPVASHPMGGRELELLPEADRASEGRVFYTQVPVYTSSDGFIADVITYLGRDWRVVSVQDLADNGACFIANAVLVNPQS